MLCLVTGANGHLGNTLVRELLKQGHTVRAGVRDINNRAPFVGLDCELVYAELQDEPAMLKALERLSFFYYEESCGQCTPCREGTSWMYKVVHRIENGQGRPDDLDLLGSVTTNIMGRTICALGDAASMPVQSFIKHFRDEFAYHIEHKKCLVPLDVQRAGSGFFKATV